MRHSYAFFNQSQLSFFCQNCLSNELYFQIFVLEATSKDTFVNLLFYNGLFTSAIGRIVHSTEMLSESYQTCLEIYETPKVELKISLEDIKKQLPMVDLDVAKEEFEKSLSLFNEVKKMISEE